MHKPHCNYWRCSHHIGLFLVVLYVLCFLWYFVNPSSRELHVDLLRLSFLGFAGMDVMSFILGAIQSYIWAYIGMGVWMLVGCCFKSGKECEQAVQK